MSLGGADKGNYSLNISKIASFQEFATLLVFCSELISKPEVAVHEAVAFSYGKSLQSNAFGVENLKILDYSLKTVKIFKSKILS